MKHLAACLVLGSGLGLSAVQHVQAQSADEAKAFIEKYASPVSEWTGPTEGPEAASDKTIVMLAADMTNGGVLGAANGVEEAAEAIGWDVTIIEGGGTVSGRSSTFGQALTLKPDGVIILGYNPTEQQAGMAQLRDAGIPMVTWHSVSGNGPSEEHGIFANITTDAQDVARAAAYWAYLDAEEEPAVVIFTDSTYQIAIDKADWMKEAIKELGGEVLEYVDTPLDETSTRMPQLTTTLLQRHGEKWTHSLAINDLYFDFMGPSLEAAGIAGSAAPRNVAAGDGSEAAYQRIRNAQFQAVTVAEPLNLQGWQLVDEMNRALAGEEWSGYTSPLHIVTAENIDRDGGTENRFDPENGYREAYKQIWDGN
ncbi:substrate-binding domain-containing protein [Paracoccus saliphilus]|uniref:Monosaccharide ABC transporter substrate-binding protein, CUT2 family n=1 Tax=Paracoccus saliphilus TaxID=405559 RepID=A0AA45W476_9RHOB|nr:substrate-binding domain-containing protein [Paracoccus saliphilus]WCR03966.1 substrate-binding domain-containing protein [Paracoccus saliphilus]SIS83218.1 monosaccharide ABC transporter substrate-binding protein, CUT2 family [Paracoccus saliphilus]